MSDLIELLERAREGDPGAAVALADFVENALADPVRTAFRIGRRAAALNCTERRSIRDAPANAPRRGGDRRARLRAERDAGLRELASLLGANLSLTRRAEEIVARMTRYQLHPNDQDCGTRQTLHRLAKTGLAIPGSRQVRRILAERPQTDE